MKHIAVVDGVEYEFEWPADMTLLDAMLAVDIPAHYSCMEGHCGTSQLTLSGGPSHMLANEVLGKFEVAQESQVLACQAIRDGEGPYRAVYE
ncbi:3-ketosteroid-9-alpha-hydroxylase reductase subunit [Corynebacterium occultum]|uniref:3-ketosteroid-9-alpha-hydroxylase reductase subunit n=1 Tax=Corynebacterium occultum TaxID=2675219 RepID=A0A6B8VRB8_9CORY|nr:2Fe-2S iron-sulfur cluster binding domain-containing protein [Corynebacterium occultum]QGU08102.1 3-ketosteroid-9-alpha-hydroxylase reductase subunit [Corynebacterium occultum]